MIDLPLQMAFIIAQPCEGTKDASCIEMCPIDCIHPTKTEAAFADVTQVYIDPHECIDCGLCIDSCPVRAIYPEDGLPEEWTRFVQLNADYFKKQKPV